MTLKKGQEFREVYNLSAAIHVQFMDCFGDRHPLHTNDQFARDHGFKKEIMHGNILNGFLSHFVGERLPVKNVMLYSQSIQYRKPVYVDEVLNFEARVEELFESVQAVDFKFSFKNAANVVVANGKFQIGILK